MFASLKAAAVLLLQLAVHNGDDVAATSVTGVSSSAPAASGGGDYLMVHGLQVDPTSLATHRTDLFRFDYPYLTSSEQPSNRSTWPGFAVRRGFAFNVSVQVNRPLVGTEDIDVYVDSETERPRFTTVANHGLDPKKPPKPVLGQYWYLLELTTAVTDPAARYEDVTVSVGDGVQSSSYVYPFPVYVLYNAYHPKDDAYCPEALLRTGYLETERTVYFQGEVTAVDVDHWYYAQYEPVMLEAAFYLLRHNETILADPRATVQQLMKLIGYWDESKPPQGNPEGLLNGHWFDENFTNGTNPDDWVSSLDIVQQWYDGGKKPVNYGQCWVFGCLGRTLTASLGLVSRQVSGFATMVDGSVTQYTNGIEQHTFPDGKYHHLVMFFFDSTGAMRFQWGMIWNFHSWAEVYFSSADEGRRFAGWHAADPTNPGAGPASVRAIHDLVEGTDYQVTDFIGDLHCTIVSKLVQCNDAVEHAKAPANTTTCPEVSTLSVRARGVAKVLTTDPTDPFTRLDVTSAYVNHSVDAFVPLPDGSKPYPEAMAEESLDPAEGDKAAHGSHVLALLPTPAKLAVRVRGDAAQPLGQPLELTVDVTGPHKRGEDQVVTVAVAGDLLPINTATRLQSVLRETHRVVLNEANQWRASVEIAVDVLAEVRAALRTLGPARHFVEMGVLATLEGSDEAVYERTPVLLKPPPLRVEAATRLERTAVAAGRKVLPAAVDASHEFTANVISPFLHAVDRACVKVSTLHHVRLGVEGVQCFDHVEPGQLLPWTRMVHGVAAAAAANYHLMFVVNGTGQPSAKALHMLALV